MIYPRETQYRRKPQQPFLSNLTKKAQVYKTMNVTWVYKETKYVYFLPLQVQHCSITLALSKMDMEELSSHTIFSSCCTSSTLLFFLDHIVYHNQVLNLNKNFSDLNWTSHIYIVLFKSTWNFSDQHKTFQICIM